MFQIGNLKYVFLIKNKIAEKHKKEAKMDLQDKYDELDNIISTLRILIDDLTDKEYIGQLQSIQYQAQDELDEIEPKLQEEYDKETEHQLQEYWNSRF